MSMRRRLTLCILLIAIGTGLYTQRTAISEWYRSVMAPELPEAVGYEEVAEVDDVDLGDNVEEVEESVEDEPSESDLSEPVEEEITNETPVEEAPPENDTPVDELPREINLAVPFTSQAPHGIWAEPYKESCEEASVYMVHAYYDGQPGGQIPADEADREIVDMVAFERELFGSYEDTNAEQTGLFAELKFGLAYTLIPDPTVEQIKTELAAGRPVIVPAAGRLLGNPYFTPPGPIYHMLVIRGYTQDDQFIVNDPGTYRGEAYLYDVDTLMYAIHDWNNGEEITQGRKVVLVLNP